MGSRHPRWLLAVAVAVLIFLAASLSCYKMPSRVRYRYPDSPFPSVPSALPSGATIHVLGGLKILSIDGNVVGDGKYFVSPLGEGGILSVPTGSHELVVTYLEATSSEIRAAEEPLSIQINALAGQWYWMLPQVGEHTWAPQFEKAPCSPLILDISAGNLSVPLPVLDETDRVTIYYMDEEHLNFIWSGYVGSVPWEWDGRNTSGQQVAEGIYQYVIDYLSPGMCGSTITVR